MVGYSFSPNGVLLDGLVKPSNFSPSPSKFKRGKIYGFSAHSACRLRETLFRLRGPGDPWAFTFTFPYDLSCAEYYRLTNVFFQRLRRLNIGMIWRVELTLRKRPHLHCVSYCEDVDRVFLLMRSWWDVVNAYAYSGGVDHSCVCKCVSGSRWWQYVAAHTSKHKSCQVGWRGRQWGVICRSSFVDDVSSVSLSPSSLFRVLRVLRRLSHCRSNQRGLFGSSVWFCSPDTAFRLHLWAEKESLKT